MAETRTDTQVDLANTADLIFVKSVKGGIPNRNPDDNDARRLLPDGRVSISDVSVKRDGRDYVASRYGGQEGLEIFFRQERNEQGALYGRGEMGRRILERHGVDPNTADVRRELARLAWDVRTSGLVYSVGGENFSTTGPVQLSLGHSFHPVETRFLAGTSVLPSRNSTARRRSSGAGAEEEGEAGARQGTNWSSFIIPFAVFWVPGRVYRRLAEDQELGTSKEDIDLYLEALWLGTLMRQSRARGEQRPLFLMHVEYKEPDFRIGGLEEDLRLEPDDREVWFSENAPTRLSEVRLDVTGLRESLESAEDRILRARYQKDRRLQLVGSLEGVAEEVSFS